MIFSIVKEYMAISNIANLAFLKDFKLEISFKTEQI